MPDLVQSFSQADFGHLKIVAEKWGITLEAPDARKAREELTERLLDPDLMEEGLELLPVDAFQALSWLESEGGKVRWIQFEREYGAIREMGAGRRDRERPDQSPISTAERLFYLGLIGRGFFDTDFGPQEFVYLPEDLRGIIRPFLQIKAADSGDDSSLFLGRLATPEERQQQKLAGDWILDHTCTLISAARMKLDPAIHLEDVGEAEIEFYLGLLEEMEILQEGEVEPEEIRTFLEMKSEESFLNLWMSWRSSEGLHDLNYVPGLQVEGEKKDYPLNTRKTVLAWLERIPPDSWWSISALIAEVKQKEPDFLRVSGDYHSWFIKDLASGEYLRGFEHWDDVEGAFLHYLITGPLHWLGMVDLASPGGEEEDLPPASFRLSRWAADLFQEQEPDLSREVEEGIQVRSRGVIVVSRLVDRRVRYQIARLCDWLPIKAEAYRFRFSPSSLDRAKEQGLGVPHLLALLEKYARAVPLNLHGALSRWSDEGAQSVITTQVILRVHSPAVLEALKKSRAKRYLGDQIGPTTVIIQKGSEERVAGVLMEMGFMVSDQS